MLIAGLTGSIGMGKSTAAAHFRSRGIPVFDADAAVHALYSGRAVPEIEKAFPGTTAAGAIDREKLAAALRKEPAKFKDLEAIVHPMVHEAEKKFLMEEAARGTRLVVLEIPLLFETGRDSLVDVTIVVSAPRDIQSQRVLERPGMTEERLESLHSRQMPDDEKRRRADFIVDTGGTHAQSESQLDAIIEDLKSRMGEAFSKHWQ